jgi:hypothetical protein
MLFLYVIGILHPVSIIFQRSDVGGYLWGRLQCVLAVVPDDVGHLPGHVAIGNWHLSQLHHTISAFAQLNGKIAQHSNELSHEFSNLTVVEMKH